MTSVAAALLSPAAALACSPVAGYVRPSNFELVQIADVIVIAAPIDGRRDRNNPWDSRVKFRVAETLKGTPVNDIEVAGLGLGRSQPSNPKSITFSHPEGHHGPCNRMTVSNGASYILLLERSKDGYRPLGYPFSRVSENYAGEDAIWTRVVREYLSIQHSYAGMAQLGKLEEIRADVLAKPKRTAYEAAIATDVEGHLGSISPWKPTEFLLAAYDDHKAGKPARYATRDRSFDTEQSDAQALTELIASELGGHRGRAAPPDGDPVRQQLIEALVKGDHPGAMGLFEGFAQPGASADDLALAIRFFAKNGRYHDAYRLIETRAVDLMAMAPEPAFRTLAAAIGEAQQDPLYGEGQPRWRSDSAATARWPQLARKLSETAKQRFGDDTSYYTETLRTSLSSNYRADPDLTLALSGDVIEITDWAARELEDPENLRISAGEAGGTSTDPLYLPLLINLRWFGVGGDDVVDRLTRAFCIGPVQRRTIFKLWGRTSPPYSLTALLRLAASPEVDATDRQVLAEAARQWSDRQAAGGEGAMSPDDALSKLIEAQPITARDIAPSAPIRCPR